MYFASSTVVDRKWAAAGELTNGWKNTFAGGRAGYDPGLRAALTKYEVGAQLFDQVIYPNTSVDDRGEALTGERNYALQFDAGQTPARFGLLELGHVRPRHAVREEGFHATCRIV
jgi:hypothetical protein